MEPEAGFVTITVSIMQPTYLPWMGYFDLIDRSDVFVFLDDVQFSKQSWQQRNRVLSLDGDPLWLTVPVHASSTDEIQEVEIDNSQQWRKEHRKSLLIHYDQAPHVSQYRSWIEEMYHKKWIKLADLNTHLIQNLTNFLSLDTKFVFSSDLDVSDGKTDRLVDICDSFGAETYLSPIGSIDYLDPDGFRSAGIELRLQNFEHPTYEQFADGFESHLSVLDLLLHKGENSTEKLREGQREPFGYEEARQATGE